MFFGVFFGVFFGCLDQPLLKLLRCYFKLIGIWSYAFCWMSLKIFELMEIIPFLRHIFDKLHTFQSDYHRCPCDFPKKMKWYPNRNTHKLLFFFEHAEISAPRCNFCRKIRSTAHIKWNFFSSKRSASPKYWKKLPLDLNFMKKTEFYQFWH